jgi:formate C-acetyltransferase
MNNTILSIKQRMFEGFQKEKEIWCPNETILDNAEVKKEPLVVRKALAIDHLLKTIPVIIKDYDLIAGIANKGTWEFGFVFPHYALPEELEEAAKYGLDELSIFGHHPINFSKALTLGFKGYRKRIYEKIEEETEKEKPGEGVLNEYRAMLISLDAVCRYAKRYSDCALNMALKEKNDKRRHELLEISRILTMVPENPPESFYEALQMHWIIYSAMHTAIESVPAGRSDQYLYPFYKADIDKAAITSDDARVLLASWLAKYSDRVEVNPEHWKYASTPKLDLYSGKDEKRHWGTAANAWLMNMILGGVDENGEDATNELSYLILETWADLELISPVMSARISPKTPQSFVETCARILRNGSAEPALYNDELIINGLVKKGIPLRDARNYSNDGCWEILIHGCTEEAFDFVSFIQALEYTLHRGMSLLRGKQEGIDQGDPADFKTFDELYTAYLRQIENEVNWRVIEKRRNLFQRASMIAPDPLLSVFMDDCIEKGKDITEGGARYAFAAPMMVGLANTVDSLAAIKKLVYEDKIFTMTQLVAAMKNNWKNQEFMRQTLLNRVPKFGNDDDYVDSIAVRLLKDFADYIKQREEEFPQLMMPIGLGTFERYVYFGLQMGATPDGRFAEETLAPNYSPMPGQDVNSVTAVLHSISKADLLPYVQGCAVDVQVNANEYKGEDGVKRMSALIRSFCDLGGTIFTLSGVDEAVLRDAQEHPENHRGLRVRYGGYSGYFISMPKWHQDIVIKKIKHGF